MALVWSVADVAGNVDGVFVVVIVEIGVPVVAVDVVVLGGEWLRGNWNCFTCIHCLWHYCYCVLSGYLMF